MKRIFLCLLAAAIVLSVPFKLEAADCAASAVGSRVCKCASVAAGATLDAQPSGTDEWIIYNVWFEYDIQVMRTDGTVTVAGPSFAVPSSGGDWQNFQPAGLNVSNANYSQFKNLHGSSAKNICIDGLRTK